MMEEAFKHVVIPDRLLTRLGPAINSGTALLLYGPAGNGKTTIAEIIGKIFKAVIYIPHCFVAEGQIVKVYDQTVHGLSPVWVTPAWCAVCGASGLISAG